MKWFHVLFCIFVAALTVVVMVFEFSLYKEIIHNNDLPGWVKWFLLFSRR